MLRRLLPFAFFVALFAANVAFHPWEYELVGIAEEDRTKAGAQFVGMVPTFVLFAGLYLTGRRLLAVLVVTGRPLRIRVLPPAERMRAALVARGREPARRDASQAWSTEAAVTWSRRTREMLKAGLVEVSAIVPPDRSAGTGPRREVAHLRDRGLVSDEDAALILEALRMRREHYADARAEDPEILGAYLEYVRVRVGALPEVVRERLLARPEAVGAS